MYWNNYDLSFILQQGIRYSVEITEPSRGYILEVFDAHFVLPNLGPIGKFNYAALLTVIYKCGGE